MVLILSITLIVFYAIFSIILYNRNLEILESEVKQEAKYIQRAIDISGTKYLAEMDAVDWGARVTCITADGEVLYDSRRDEKDLENHSEREEVREALENGEGEDVRVSDTVGRELYYYAVLLDDGSVLRVAREMDSLMRTAFAMLPAVGGLALLMLVFALALARWQTKRLIKPINELDLEHPLENAVYPELTPLLEAMDRQNKEKEAVSNMRKEFSANVSHELKTPLTSMKVLADSLVGQENVPIELYQEFMQDITDEIDRENRIITDLLSLVKLDKKANLNIELVNINDLLELILKRLRPIGAKRNIDLILDSFRPVHAEIDETKLTLAISNLVENGIKYNVDGGWVRVSLNADHKYFYVTVADSGRGIPEDSIDHIFERFYRVDKSHSTEIDGTGLGLAITRSAILMHHGAIKVYSKEGEGATFSVRIPLVFNN